MNNKKAVSPLIATILLIVVAVILVTVVLTWGKTFATDSLADTSGITDDCTAAVGSLYASNCAIGTGEITLRLKNVGSYTYVSNFDADVYPVGLDVNSHTDVVTVAGLDPGVTKIVTITDAYYTSANGPFDVTIKSQDCPTDGYTNITCR